MQFLCRAALLAAIVGVGTISQARIAAAELSPEDTVRAFYSAIAKGECDKALKFRPRYSKASCQNTTSIKLRSVEQKDGGSNFDADRFAVVYLSIDFQKGESSRGNFTGFIALKRQDASWIIGNGSYRSEKSGVKNYKDYLRLIRGTEEFRGMKPIGSVTAPDPQAAPEPPVEEPPGSADVSGQGEEPPEKPSELKRDGPPAQTAYVDDERANDRAVTRRRPKVKPDPPQDDATADPGRIMPKTRDDTAAPRRDAVAPVSRAASMGRDMWTHGGPATFGSRKIFQACWSPGDLRGRKGEKKTRKTGPGAWMGPPARKRPTIKLGTLPRAYRRSIRRVDTGGRKLVALTFDTGERNNDFAGYDAEIVDYLRRHRIKATFYFGGKWMATHPDRTLQLIADPLFEMGNHAWTHGNMRVLNGKEMHDQVLYTQAQYELMLDELRSMQCVADVGIKEMRKIPAQIPTFRYPYGTCSGTSLQAVNDHGLPAVQWDVVTADPARRQTAKGIARIVLKNTRPGSIVIMHSNGRGWKTGKALPLFIPELQKRGYEFVTVSELLRQGDPIATKTCFELRPGDNKHYDKIFGKGTGD